MNVVYSQIESEIVNRLAAVAASNAFVAVQLPQTQEEFSRPFTTTLVTVAYKSSEFGEPRSPFEISQEERLQIEVVVQSRTLRGVGGVHAVVESIKRRLLGFAPTDCSKMYIARNAFTEHNSDTGVWAYSIVFETKYLVVEDKIFNTETPLQTVTLDIQENDPVVYPQLPLMVTLTNTAGDVIATITPGVTFELPDSEFQIVINGVPMGSVSIATLSDEDINIQN
jgi:hypothetical protein